MLILEVRYYSAIITKIIGIHVTLWLIWCRISICREAVSFLFTAKCPDHRIMPKCKKLTQWKRPWWRKDRGHKKKGMTEDEKASLTQWTWVWANSGDNEGQGSVMCCSPWVAKSQTQLSNWITTTKDNALTILMLKKIILICNSFINT